MSAKQRSSLPCLLTLALLASGCERATSASEVQTEKQVPAKVVAAEAPGAPPSVVLSPEAEARLGIATSIVERVAAERTLFVPGVIELPGGRSLVVSAPVAGTLVGAPAVGAMVALDQVVFELAPLLTPEREVLTPAERVQTARAAADLEVLKATAEGQVAVQSARLDAARTAHARAEQLVRAEAGSQRALDEAGAELAMAGAALKAAQTSLATLAKVTLEIEAPDRELPANFALKAPLAGQLVALHAGPGQQVTAGAPLFEVAAFDPLWVRVPVYVGDLDRIDAGREARVGGLARGAELPGRIARPVAAPPSASPTAATADLRYELEGGAGGLRPGQRVGVTLFAAGEVERLRLPWSALLFDASGAAWVYERTAARSYRRRRVELERIDGEHALLTRGPEPGTEVVVAGAAELHGTEFEAKK